MLGPPTPVPRCGFGPAGSTRGGRGRRYPPAVANSEPGLPARPLATRTGVLAVVGGLGTGIVLTAVVAGAALASSDYDADAPTGPGAYVGRVVRQRLIDGVEATAPGFPLWLIAILQIPLWVGLLGAPLVLAHREGATLRELYGLRVERRDVGVGMVAGVLTQLVVVPLLYLPLFWLLGERDLSQEARALTDKAGSPVGVTLLVVVVLVGAPFVEELFFRGLLFRTLQSDARLGPTVVVAGSAVVFGLAHLQIFQFPALVAFGVVAAVLVHRYRRLGPAIWAHVGFNLVTVVALLAA